MAIEHRVRIQQEELPQVEAFGPKQRLVNSQELVELFLRVNVPCGNQTVSRVEWLAVRVVYAFYLVRFSEFKTDACEHDGYPETGNGTNSGIPALELSDDPRSPTPTSQIPRTDVHVK